MEEKIYKIPEAWPTDNFFMSENGLEKLLVSLSRSMIFDKPVNVDESQAHYLIKDLGRHGIYTGSTLNGLTCETLLLVVNAGDGEYDFILESSKITTEGEAIDELIAFHKRRMTELEEIGRELRLEYELWLCDFPENGDDDFIGGDDEEYNYTEKRSDR